MNWPETNKEKRAWRTYFGYKLIPVKVLKGHQASDWIEDQNFNYAFHQHYRYKGEIIDGISRVFKTTNNYVKDGLEGFY